MPGTAEELRGTQGCVRKWLKVLRVPLGVFSFVVETRAETRAETRKTRDTKRVQHSKTKTKNSSENEELSGTATRGVIEWIG